MKLLLLPPADTRMLLSVWALLLQLSVPAVKALIVWLWEHSGRLLSPLLPEGKGKSLPTSAASRFIFGALPHSAPGHRSRTASPCPASQPSRDKEPAASTEPCSDPQPCTCAGHITSGSCGLCIPLWSLCQIPTSCFTVSCKPSHIHEFIVICTVMGSGSIYQCNTL